MSRSKLVEMPKEKEVSVSFKFPAKGRDRIKTVKAAAKELGVGLSLDDVVYKSTMKYV